MLITENVYLIICNKGVRSNFPFYKFSHFWNKYHGHIPVDTLYAIKKLYVSFYLFSFLGLTELNDALAGFVDTYVTKGLTLL